MNQPVLPARSFAPWMRMALYVGQAALPDDVPVGCVVLRDGQLIASAHNRREVDRDPVAHAEVLALRQAAAHIGDWRLTGCIVVVTLEPCPMCASLLTQARVAKVVYGISDPLWGACGSRYALWEGPVVAGVLESDCRKQLDSFFTSRRKSERQ